jgi:transcriptional regulator with XRE-family HTH domain
MTIGEYIKAFRKEKGISQDTFSKFIGVSHDTISLWELGKSKPDYETLQKLCIILNISGDEALEIETAEERKKVIINNSFNNNTGKQNIRF